MSARWIIPQKLTVPAVDPGCLRRPQLEGGAAVRLFLAGPGYGKTAALAAIAAQARAAGRPVVWYTVDELDCDAATFFLHLTAGVRAHIPPFGEGLTAMIEGGRATPRQLWHQFFGELADYNLPGLLLVLDDLHHLVEAQPELARALTAYFDKLPAGMEVAIAGRQRPDAALARLSRQGLLTTFGPAALRYTPHEIDALLASRDAEAVRARLEPLDGWPLGVALALDTTSEWAGTASTEAEIAAYLTDELFERLSPPRRAFLLRASLLPELTAEACLRVFQEPDDGAHLAALTADHLLERLGDGPAYRLPGYLHRFLRDEARRRLSSLQLTDWHRRAAGWCEEQGQDEQALHHWLAAREWEQSAAVAARCFPAMRHSGRHATIDRCLAAFPAEGRDLPVLTLWRAHRLARGGKPAEALVAYEAAGRGFDQQDDAAGAFKALVCQINLALVQEDRPRFGALMSRALSRQRDAAPEDLADLHLIRAMAAEQRGDMALMRECNDDVLAVPIEGDHERAASHTIALMNLFTWAYQRGDLEEAAGCATRAVAVAEAHGFLPFRLTAGFLLATVQLCRGEREAATAFFDGLPSRWEELLDWHDLACAYYAIGFRHLCEGAWKEAETALKRSLEVFGKAGYEHGKKVPLEALLWLAVFLRQTGRVPALLAEVGEIGTSSVLDLALAIPRARALDLEGRTGEAIALLESAVPELEALEAHWQLARARLVEAAARGRSGDAAGASSAHAEALRLISVHGYGLLKHQDRDLWEELGRLAPRPETLTRVVPAAPEPAGCVDIRFLGGFEVTLEGVALDVWPRRRARLVLAYLLLNPGGLRLEELAAAVGAEPGADGKYTGLLSDMVGLRRVFEPTLAKNAPSRYLLRDGELYVWNWETIGHWDVGGFRAAFAEAERAEDSEAAEAAYERAIALYGGNLLPDRSFADGFTLERNALLHQALAALATLGERHFAQGRPEGTEALLVRAIRLAPCEEDVYLRLMRHHLALGRLDRARTVYWDCRKALKAHLGLAPSEDFEAAYRAIAQAAPAAWR
jgi:ATP/maltotriose-dependent transcriptional regulator MalT/DNA-binding SARP family transcriptional activator